MTALERANQRNGLLFCAPWLIGLSVFLVYPLFKALYFSLCDYSVLLPPVFIGFGNYSDLFQDTLFWKSLYNTSFYAVGAVSLGVLTALSLALLLNTKVKGLAFYRTIFFLPSLMPAVAGAILWLWIYNGESGILNTAIRGFGDLFGLHIPGPAWMADPAWTKPAMIFMAVWGAGNSMVIFLAGLQDVPNAIYEAAIIDGASFWQRLIHVTIPMISPVIYFNVIMGIIGGFQAFTQALVMTDATGGPERSALFYVLQLYNVGFQDMRMGYACAMAWVLFAIILALTYVATTLSKRWVIYDR
ncbi:MAG TPA: sugar ABC transporter permease [Polyangiaceae bacterium]|jgi:multiple sugar transport system permease protein|nr:sugar ABC transporter permease [Polyangiaceae bacterium]